VLAATGPAIDRSAHQRAPSRIHVTHTAYGLASSPAYTSRTTFDEARPWLREGPTAADDEAAEHPGGAE